MDTALALVWVAVGMTAFQFVWFGWLARRIPPTWWYIRPLKRRAMRLALEACIRANKPYPIDWKFCRIQRIDRVKTFVTIALDAQRFHRPYFVYLVWHDREDVEEIVPVRKKARWWPSDTVEQYESNRASEQR